MRNLDFSSWQALLSLTLLGLGVITLIGVGIRLLAMQVIQQRRERGKPSDQRTITHALIAAYKTSWRFRLHGKSCRSILPTCCDLRRRGDSAVNADVEHVWSTQQCASANDTPGEPCKNQCQFPIARDACAMLSKPHFPDIVLLGTEEQGAACRRRPLPNWLRAVPCTLHELVVVAARLYPQGTRSRRGAC